MICISDWMTLSDEDARDEEDGIQSTDGWTENTDLLWKKEEWEKAKKLKVHFLNDIPDGWMNCRGRRITKKEILEIANEWHNCNKHVVPEFVFVKKRP